MTKQKEKPPVREQITIRLPMDLLEHLRQEAEERGMSFNGYVMTILTSRS